MTQLIGDLKSGTIPNFDRNPAKEMESYLNLFLEYGWTEKGEGYLDTYERLHTAFLAIEEDMENIITDIVMNTPNMKRFLILHSVFYTNLYTKRDWLEDLMASLLRPTKDDMSWFDDPVDVPKEILSKFHMFDPEPIRYWFDPVRVEYKMYGKPNRGESYEPIHVIDLDWDEIKMEKIDMEKRIKEFDVITL